MDLECYGLLDRPEPGDKESTKRRRRKEGCRGPKSLVEQGYFIHGSVCLYIVIQGSFRQKNKVE